MNITKHIKNVERMLAVDEIERQQGGHNRLNSPETESIKAVVGVAKTLNDLLYSMDRLITTEEED
jgi:molybdenum-dependent DNA-binding transcriptional regulator ModE